MKSKRYSASFGNGGWDETWAWSDRKRDVLVRAWEWLSLGHAVLIIDHKKNYMWCVDMKDGKPYLVNAYGEI